jgi:hypothetical protein
MEAESTMPGISSGDLVGCAGSKLKTSPATDDTFLSISQIQHPGIYVTMSFGFSVSDFLAVFQLANQIRKEFAGAPSEFKGALDV